VYPVLHLTFIEVSLCILNLSRAQFPSSSLSKHTSGDFDG
jgi:hypothetical protein